MPAPKRADRVEGRSEGGEAITRDAAIRWLHSNNTAKRRWLPNRAARICAECNIARADCRSHGAAAARSARHACRVPWILHRTISGILIRRSHREFVHIRFADDARTGVDQSLNAGCRVKRREIFQEFRSAGEPRTFQREDIFYGEGHLREWPSLCRKAAFFKDLEKGIKLIVA